MSHSSLIKELPEDKNQAIVTSIISAMNLKHLLLDLPFASGLDLVVSTMQTVS